MIFKQTWQQVLDGTKTQTRRPVKPKEYGYHLYHPDIIQAVYRDGGYIKWRVGKDYAVQPGRGKPAIWIPPEGSPIDDPLAEYVRKTESVRATWGPKVKEWLRSKGYREARIRIKEIRRERLRDISIEDCRAEGITKVLARFAYEQLWNSLYRKPYPLYDDDGNVVGYLRCSWEDNPEVWVLEFEVINET